MCRLYGVHSQLPTRPHYLLDAETGFVALSSFHKDGWGMASYQEALALNHSLLQASQDPRFFELGALPTRTLIAHLRLATIGEHRVTNNHPFRYRDWTFAHNGNIKHFERYRELILSQISPHFQFAIQGDTDSELIFLFILTELDRWGLVTPAFRATTRQLGQAVKWALENLLALIGPFRKESGPPTETYISFLMSNGEVMLAHQGGQPLYYQERSDDEKALDEIVFCSAPLGDADNWQAMNTGELIAVDQSIQLYPIRGY